MTVIRRIIQVDEILLAGSLGVPTRGLQARLAFVVNGADLSGRIELAVQRVANRPERLHFPPANPNCTRTGNSVTLAHELHVGAQRLKKERNGKLSRSDKSRLLKPTLRPASLLCRLTSPWAVERSSPESTKSLLKEAPKRMSSEQPPHSHLFLVSLLRILSSQPHSARPPVLHAFVML